jgi:hypothetical protein
MGLSPSDRQLTQKSVHGPYGGGRAGRDHSGPGARRLDRLPILPISPRIPAATGKIAEPAANNDRLGEFPTIGEKR